MLDFKFNIELLGEHIKICVSDEHRFGTDAFLLENFANVRHKDTVCDLGTGCGIIPLLMEKNRAPKHIYAVDIQQKAITQLEHSLELNSLTEKITAICSDLNKLELPSEMFDVITCNPPYKANNSGIKNPQQEIQIARHEIMCTIEDICNVSAKMLKFGGKLVLCQRPERLCDVMCAMRNAGIEPKLLRFVAKKEDSAPWLFLIEGKKQSKPFMQVMPTLFMYEGEDFSKEIKQIYGSIPK